MALSIRTPRSEKNGRDEVASEAEDTAKARGEKTKEMA